MKCIFSLGPMAISSELLELGIWHFICSLDITSRTILTRQASLLSRYSYLLNCIESFEEKKARISIPWWYIAFTFNRYFHENTLFIRTSSTDIFFPVLRNCVVVSVSANFRTNSVVDIIICGQMKGQNKNGFISYFQKAEQLSRNHFILKRNVYTKHIILHCVYEYLCLGLTLLN
jgi:hypothetical protein